MTYGVAVEQRLLVERKAAEGCKAVAGKKTAEGWKVVAGQRITVGCKVAVGQDPVQARK